MAVFLRSANYGVCTYSFKVIYFASKVLDGVKTEGEEEIGVDILRRALLEPVRQIANNAGKNGDVVVEEVKRQPGNYGYNAVTDKYEDLVEAGIVDPTKVTRTALQNAASIAAMLLTTEAVVTDLPTKKEEHNHGGMGGGMEY